MVHLNGEVHMKRICLMITVAAGLLIPLAAFAGHAGAANPHGSKGDPSSSCQGSGGSNGGGGCDNSQLPQSNGCNVHSSPSNPHCTPAQTVTPTTTPTTAVTPASGQQGLQGQQQGGGNNAAGGNAGVAAAAPGQLPFTGIDAKLLALMGGLLLTAGLGLRRLGRAPDPAMAMFVAGPAGRGDESLPFRSFMG
jgi:hypothetical protein